MATNSQIPSPSNVFEVALIAPFLVLATEAYQSISMHPQYQNLSLEEIRLKDYDAQRVSAARWAAAHSQTPTNSTPSGWKPQSSKPQMPGTQGMLSGYVTAKLGVWAGLKNFPSRRAPSGWNQHFGYDIVVFEVGDTPTKKFSIHESIISPRSEFVRLSLKDGWKEGIEPAIKLPTDDPDVFALYQHWLYNGALRTRGSEISIKLSHEYEFLVKAYIFGDKMIDADFKDSVIGAILEKLRVYECFDLRLTNLVYENTTAQSKLLRLWLDVYFKAGKAEWLDETFVGASISCEFIMEFSRFQMRLKIELAERNMGGDCHYHEHSAGKCYLNSWRWSIGASSGSNSVFRTPTVFGSPSVMQ